MAVLTPAEISQALQTIETGFKKLRPYILEHAGKAGFDDKADGSPVTEIDLYVESNLVALLSKQTPNTPVYGEEAGYSDDLSGSFWLLDPIDGTKSFIENIPAFTGMAVLIQNGEAIASLIYNIANDITFTAQKGLGAFKNGSRLNLAEMSLPKKAHCKTEFIPILNELFADEKIQFEKGQAGGGNGFTLVSDGSIAARFNLHGGGYTHDYAPGALLVSEAGGKNVPVLESSYRYKTKSFVTCHPALENKVKANISLFKQLELQK